MHDGTALPIFKNGEIGLRQIGDRVALLIDHTDIQLHQRCVSRDDIVGLLTLRADDGQRKDERKRGNSKDQSRQLGTAIFEFEKGHAIRNNTLDAGLGLSMPATSESLQPPLDGTALRIAVSYMNLDASENSCSQSLPAR